MVYLHGNGANLSTPENVERYEALRRLGFQIVAPEYPGFGEVNGTPSEAALDAAARDAWDWLREQGVPASAIVIYGWSLGSGVATDLASAVDERAVILEGAFSGVDDRASELYPWLPIRLMVRNRFASRERIARLGSPLLLLHATDDTIVPVSHARTLLAAAREPRRLVELTGGHVHLNRRDEARYTQALQAFFASVFPSADLSRSALSGEWLTEAGRLDVHEHVTDRCDVEANALADRGRDGVAGVHRDPAVDFEVQVHVILQAGPAGEELLDTPHAVHRACRAVAPRSSSDSGGIVSMRSSDVERTTPRPAMITKTPTSSPPT